MIIEKTVELACSATDSYRLVHDFEQVATYLPGARFTGTDEDTYRGEIEVKVGPISTNFAGTARILESDETARSLSVRASGKDRSNRGAADVSLTLQIMETTTGGSRLQISADVRLRGLIAQFGRNMVDEIADMLISQFAANVAAALAEPGVEQTAPTAARPTRQSHGTHSPALADNAAALSAGTLLLSLIRPRLGNITVGFAGGLLVGWWARSRVRTSP